MRWLTLACLFGGLITILSIEFLLPIVAARADEIEARQSPDTKLRAEPVSPEQSLAMITVDDGYTVRLLAHEPEVIDPVDVAMDDRGRMWVVEMIDYPFREEEAAPLRGRVRVLTDSDGNGIFDKSEVFADQLDMPTGLALWRDGVLVTLAGKLVFMRDTNGDGKVDEQQTWLSGFTLDNEQLRANHPRLGPDGWWYIACGLRGGKLVIGPGTGTPKDADVAFDIGSRDVRFDPATNKAEPITGPAQFGLCWDDSGTRMFCSNRNPCTQVLFDQTDLESNPLTGIIPSTRDVLPSGEASQIFAIAPSWTTSNLHAGQFTAACGVYFSQAPSMSDDVRGDALACEPTGSLVHRRTVSHDGVTWTPLGELPTKEWLASKDEWFRPVNIVAAPGGGVIVVDMHRAVIEHPRWVPDELKNRPDQRWGNSAGRVYWVGNSDNSFPNPLLQQLKDRPLSTRSDQELANLVASEDTWLRQTVSRLLIERDARNVAPELEKVATDREFLPSARCAALFLLARLSPMKTAPFVDALNSSNRSLKVTALRLIGNKSSLDARGVQQILELALTVGDPWVRMEAVLCLARSQADSVAGLNSEQIGQLARLAATHSDDPALIVSVAGACKRNAPRMLAEWLDALSQPTDRKGVPAHIAVASKKLSESVLRESPNAWSEVLRVANEILTTSSTDIGRVAALAAMTQWASVNKKNVSDTKIDESVWNRIRQWSLSAESSSDLSVAAIELLGFSTIPSDADLLGSIVRSKAGSAIRFKSLRAWSETGAMACDEFLVAELPLCGPQLQPTVFELILAKPPRMQTLLDRLDSGTFTSKQIGAVQLSKLAERSTGPVRDGFKRHLATIANSDRASVIDDYTSCLSLPAKPERGREIFTRHCAACHKIDTVGVSVGPDISDSRTQKPEQLLTSILDPNRAIDNNYFRYIVLTDDGRTFEGIVSEETGDSIVLRGQNDARNVIRRESIELLKATGVSMMPDGVESQIDKQSMADLIAFIKGWRYMNGAVPASQ